MQTVKIPDYVSPTWSCVINGKTYSYPSGTTQSVPDEVAALIANIESGQPQKRPRPAAGVTEIGENSTDYEVPTAKAVKDYADEQAGDRYTKAETDTLLLKKQGKYVAHSITLTAVGWDSTDLTQTVTVTGVTAANDIDVASAPSNYEEYGKAGIYAVTQATDSVTFKCKKVPENNITVYIRIWEG